MYLDAIVRAIRTKFAPDFATALRDANHLDLVNPRNSVMVPLQADVSVAYDKKLADFIVTGRVFYAEKCNYLNYRSVFSTREFNRASDKAAMIEYLFDGAKHKMLESIANGEIDEVLGRLEKDHPRNQTKGLER